MGFFNLLGGAVKGSTSVTLWTANMIHTAIQNARTRKEIQKVYQNAYDTNLYNRSVNVLPGASKELLLTSNEPEDDDIGVMDIHYINDPKTISKTPALDYIWGDPKTLDSIIVSGGQSSERVCSLIPFVYKAQSNNIPVFVLHSGNQNLENMIINNSVDSELISRGKFYYDVFRGLPVDDMAYLLYETMPKDTAKPAAESLFRALLEVLLLKTDRITINSLASYSLISLKKDIDDMKKNGLLSDDEYDEINQYCMAGSSETDAVRIFLSKLNRQFEAVFGKPLNNYSNIKRMLNRKGVIAINVGSGNDLLLSLVINHLQLLQSQGKAFDIVLDDILIPKCKDIVNLIRGQHYAISNQDFISSLYGGEKNGDELFSELTGNVNTLVLFRHASGTSSLKWSDHLGKYKKIRIRYNISQSNSFINSSDSRGISVDEADEPRIRSDVLEKLDAGVACIRTLQGILIAEVKDLN